MELDWSEQSPHIRSLFRPWQSGDGYEEATIAAAEAHCLPDGRHLPSFLRSFYGTWGRRHDLTRMNEHLVPPEEWIVHSDALIFCVENQGCAYWALPLANLELPNPPVVVADAGPERSLREITQSLEWQPNYRSVSSFLDALTYLHAFSHGAIHGAWSERMHPQWWQIKWFEREWREIEVLSPQSRDIEETDDLESPLFVREGEAIQWFDRFSAVARSAGALDEIAHVLAIDWEERW